MDQFQKCILQPEKRLLCWSSWEFWRDAWFLYAVKKVGSPDAAKAVLTLEDDWRCFTKFSVSTGIDVQINLPFVYV